MEDSVLGNLLFLWFNEKLSGTGAVDRAKAIFTNYNHVGFFLRQIVNIYRILNFLAK
jgi:hypothetical protein